MYWVLLIPAIASVIYAIPYLLGGAIGWGILGTLLKNPTGLLAILSGVIGLYIVYSSKGKKTKEGLIAIGVGAGVFLLPQFFVWSGTLFSNIYFMLMLTALLVVYFLGVNKKLSGKNLYYLFISLIGSFLFLTFLPMLGKALPGGGLPGVSPTPSWWSLDMNFKLSRDFWGKAKMESMSVLDKSKTSFCWETFPSAMYPFPGDENFYVKVLDENGNLIAQKSFTAHFSTGAWTAQKQVTLCLKSGIYTIKAYAEDSSEVIVSERLMLE